MSTHPEASAQEIELFVKAADQRYAELGIKPEQARQLLAATLAKMAEEVGFGKQALPVVTPAANAVSTGARSAGEAWDALPDWGRSSLVNALISGGLVGGGTALVNKMSGGQVDQDQVLRNAILGAIGGGASPLISNALQGVMGKMNSAELVVLGEGILKHGQVPAAPRLPSTTPVSKPGLAGVGKPPLPRKPAVAAPLPKMSHAIMSKKAQAFVAKVRQYLKTNAG